MHNAFIEDIKKRRTQYSLGKNVSLSAASIEEVIKDAVRQSPSAFNSQSARVVLLFDQESDTFWELTTQILRKIVPQEAFAATEKKMTSFTAGVGTILFFEDQEVIKEYQNKFALYADNFPIWSEQSSGIAQFAVWSALANLNIGASLQHYNPLVDAAVAETWDIPTSWKLRAQMPFGANEKPFPEKTYIADDKRFKCFGRPNQ